jgi:hypothetical protein
VREPLRVHGPAVFQQGAQLLEPGLGEEGARPILATPDLDQPAVEQALDSERDLRLAPVRAGVPGAQEDAVRNRRVLAEVAAELAADQLALAGGEGGSRGVKEEGMPEVWAAEGLLQASARGMNKPRVGSSAASRVRCSVSILYRPDHRPGLFLCPSLGGTMQDRGR